MNDPYEQAALGEYQRAQGELRQHSGVLKPLANAYGRFDKLIARSIEESPVKPACKAGCAYCCYYKVEVKAHELLLILDYLQQHLAPAQRQQIQAEASHNADLISRLSPEQHLSTNLKCPFLQDQRCSVYPVRPFRCRSFHALEVSGCEASYATPADLSISSELIESVSLFGAALSQGFEAAAQSAQYDARTYDLNTALVAAFRQKNAALRYKQGKQTFVAARVVEDD
jgi:Fe-S-cluster containining protein